jgi:hypothetical protein
MRKCYCGQGCLGCVFGIPESMVEDWPVEFLSPTPDVLESLRYLRNTDDGIRRFESKDKLCRAMV